MSLRDDVILRVIHQLVEALLRAAGLRKKKDLPAAEQALGEGLHSLGLTLDLVRRMPPDTLVRLVPDETRRALLAAALAELALTARARGEHDDADRLDRSARALVAGLDVAALPAEVRDALPATVRE